MHAVIVDGDVSYPPTSGKRLRTLHLMERLAARHDVTYIARCQTPAAASRQATEYFRDRHIESIFVDEPLPKKKGLSFYARLGANAVVSPWPYSVTSHQSAAMRQTVNAYATGHAVDLWQFEWSGYLPSLSVTTRAPKLLIAHNVDTLIWRRYHENAGGFAKRLFLKQQTRKFERFERWAFNHVDRVVAVSSDDAALIREQFHQPNVDVVENGIDRDFFASVECRRDPHRILFLGALDWRPNQDAVQLLLDKIFPEVLAQEPQARLVIVGRDPGPGLRGRVAQVPQVELHADVPDVRPFLAGCGMMTVPLRIGGGSRLKILEALACGLPVMSSRVGAEGLNLSPDRHYTLAEENAMAAALVKGMRQPEALRQGAAAGRAMVLEAYDWGTLANKLQKTWESMVAGARGQK
jgi:glycosyltransferase involved in cell wall biosynthesis